MSLQTTEAQAAARAAEADWSRHRKTCATCGDRRRGAKPCRAGLQMRADARELRAQAREAKAADARPGPGDVSLFGAAELGGPWRVAFTCGHEMQTEYPAKPKQLISCLPCQVQRRVVSVTAGQGPV